MLIGTVVLHIDVKKTLTQELEKTLKNVFL